MLLRLPTSDNRCYVKFGISQKPSFYRGFFSRAFSKVHPPVGPAGTLQAFVQAREIGIDFVSLRLTPCVPGRTALAVG